MDVAEDRGYAAHIFFWLYHPFDVPYPVGHWQCGLMKQSIRLELWSRLVCVYRQVIYFLWSV